MSDVKLDIPFHLPIKEIILQAGIAGKAAELCQNYGKRGFLVCDENTKNFVNLPYETLVLSGNQKPELTKAQEISKHEADFFIAVGSGSLNDLVKYASFLAGKPYIVFGTAPSMNGYASANASLLVDGYKQSFSAHAPQAIYMDTEIMAAAPRRLINSGIGDSICRGTCEADVLLSKQVLGTPDYRDFFTLIRKYEEQIFDDIEALCRTLTYSGAAMLAAGNSAPASQSEHMIAHYMELMQPDAPHSFHGEQIAVTTLSMARIQEKLLGQSEFELETLDAEKATSLFGEEFGAYCLKQTNEKYSKLTNLKIRPDWSLVEPVMLKAEKLEKQLKSIGAPLTPEAIGWKNEVYTAAISNSKFTRNRFTFLDLAN